MNRVLTLSLLISMSVACYLGAQPLELSPELTVELSPFPKGSPQDKDGSIAVKLEVIVTNQAKTPSQAFALDLALPKPGKTQEHRGKPIGPGEKKAFSFAIPLKTAVGIAAGRCEGLLNASTEDQTIQIPVQVDGLMELLSLAAGPHDFEKWEKLGYGGEWTKLPPLGSRCYEAISGDPSLAGFSVIDLQPIFNADGIATKEERDNTDLDGHGNSLVSEELPAPGKILSVGQIPFRMPRHHDLDHVRCEGQEIPFSQNLPSQVYLLVGATNGTQKAEFSFQGTHPDKQRISISDWCLQAGEREQEAIGLRCRYVPIGSKLQSIKGGSLYGIGLDVPRASTALILPKNRNVHVFAATTANEPASCTVSYRARVSLPAELAGQNCELFVDLSHPEAICTIKAEGRKLGQATGQTPLLAFRLRKKMPLVFEFEIESPGSGLAGIRSASISLASREMARLIGHPQNVRRFGDVNPQREEALFQPMLLALARRNAREMANAVSGTSQQRDEIAKEIKSYEVSLVGHAHIDMAYKWRWNETLHHVLPNTFGSALRRMATYPGYTFLQSQMAGYHAMEIHPEYSWMIDSIRAAIKKGQWEPVGGMWVEPDMNLPSGEALVRQFLLGQQYLEEKFGMRATVGFNPDTFGHAWTCPQIMRKAGITSYIFGRCNPGAPLFWWESPDGSRVLGYTPPEWYNVFASPNMTNTLWERLPETPGLKKGAYLYGAGDHGGGPSDRDIITGITTNDDPSFPSFKFSKAEDFMSYAAKESTEIPTIKRDLNFIFRGCYTSQGSVKRRNRLGENGLQSCESIWIAANILGNVPYPHKDFEKVWRIILFNQFHDILPGTAIHPAFDDAAKIYREAFDILEPLSGKGLAALAETVDTWGEGTPILVFNPLAWERTGPVLVNAPPGLKEPILVVSKDGEETPGQLLDDGRMTFVARTVPSVGYKVFWVKKGDAMDDREELEVSKQTLSNGMIHIDVSPLGLLSLKYTASGRMPNQAVLSEGNRLLAYGDKGNAWGIRLSDSPEAMPASRVEVVEDGPVRVAIEVSGSFRSSTWRQLLILYRGIPALFCEMNLDWNEHNVTVKASFPTRIRTNKCATEIPYGVMTRTMDDEEFPAQKWIDMSHGEGLLLLNDCKYGFDVKPGEMRMTVLRSPTSLDPEADQGSHRLAYCLIPHKGDWRDIKAYRQGYELNVPLVGSVVENRKGCHRPSWSMLRVEPDNVVLGAVKQSEDGKSMVLRLVEYEGQDCEAVIALDHPVTEAVEANLLEDPTGPTLEIDEGSKIKIPISHHEIKTVLVRKQSSQP